ncbi:preprotein translocase subunit YajC [Lysinibacillus sp. AC-3]|nr:preprotein translocase subunit YajC [Lysinibacillus sp. AC-3]
MMEQYSGLIMILIMFVAMWFILIRPAKKRQQETQNMQSSLQRGDKIITIGGLHGEIDSIEDTAVTLKIADNVRVKFDRQAIGRVVNGDQLK